MATAIDIATPRDQCCDRRIRAALISLFETANENYDWLNRVVAVGVGHSPGRRAMLRMHVALVVGYSFRRDNPHPAPNLSSDDARDLGTARWRTQTI
jgi:hypothetical protein